MSSNFMRILLGLAIAGVPGPAAERVEDPYDGVVAHEWGTFTSVAGRDGNPVSWLPLSGASDLPCFVHRIGGRSPKLASGLVRMETPVLYFYSSRPAVLSVKVDFPRGLITEWYPQATSIRPGSAAVPSGQVVNAQGGITWDGIEVRPGEHSPLPIEKAPSRYYAARETDSAEIRAGQEREKLIFYRGLGNFSIPLRTKVTDSGELQIRNAGTEPIPLVILFENRGGKLGYRIVRDLKDSLTLEMPGLSGNSEGVRREIEASLMSLGLYPKEAHAMVETWRESWLGEEGTRVLYIMPRATVDSVLPLAIAPAPKEIVRVFVGRVEILSPWMEKNIEAALVAGDIPVLEKQGRFLNAFASQIGTGRHVRAAESERTTTFLQSAYERINREFNSSACVQ
jgi:hypothetical protein